MVFILSPWASLDLREFIENKRKLESWNSALENKTVAELLVGWMACLASGLAMLHATNIKYRGLNPINVLLRITGSNILPIICDYRLSKHFDAMSRAVIQSGTMFYKSPEELRGSAVGRADDVFALGTIFVELGLIIDGVPKQRLNRIVGEDGYAKCWPRAHSTKS
ncbi:kinase-like domain-containing protein [Jimgerdemannia flammicorona]|uniref:Kinase-like domain-containing protein n=1 Tax=Jimgerdemannia flammicorona TaxID=994334 RepID=A0A433D657_9FUNG|nr:kinase-like domain-containing protein [Jimgerdemannia flammicorona]